MNIKTIASSLLIRRLGGIYQDSMKINVQVVCGSWVTNVYNPYAPNAELYYSYSPFASPEQRAREWQDHLKWIKSFEVGFPKETSHYSTERLFQMHMVGLYKRKTIITIE